MAGKERPEYIVLVHFTKSRQPSNRHERTKVSLQKGLRKVWQKESNAKHAKVWRRTCHAKPAKKDWEERIPIHLAFLVSLAFLAVHQLPKEPMRQKH
ncbi:MAG: hypothetical protein A2X67_09900 [Ignavibacteria bacterium GWA2_55_11]|nr:MAG: hypothetical protein A2X67_09900 [Ignavibacteria bacterium GWA2_55_11]OGU45463.1 MAG: hypothetical protein A2X68_00775 [Ignavibacteria bacterium GWC2_56_12]OGU66017.1 MAG: hypothetical protein A3C56_00825 [Ignavibacteria bacterium RIFCSPHIGHO2_02_FULL_56_12]OGU69399.1 MAG: hypothetical protein A3H45_01655 [Ignavibacteria bacterium RIFCSPLOWO2_02_FULL_55_14]OGU72435.1 MAG: hypothetical protein A3G43_07820 [Ignavibacteria bacterium RIFCSPLOWO2_12_FULL_56_21]HAV22567.1 hypothetical protei